MTHHQPLHGVRVAILVENGFEQVELTAPRDALRESGATTTLVSPQTRTVRGWNGDEKADAFDVDVTIADAKPLEFDALLLPGGVQSADRLRADNKSVLFVHAMQIAKKPIAVICHGPWILIETDYVRGRRMTSWPSLRTDILNAGGDWLDRAAVTDELLVSSRKPDDIPQFNDAMIALFTRRERSVA
ncbi:MAG: type 1 glutamine amidotransferase [Candidatus Eremiobacteraeota bacterium]|nr:type 1 glutamine amidotransferase [Candidatus Eremiobacteraeota bacterium]MBV8498074.1 type 1 glutamine amidotransferase [Candidatus Eremiobacteraeota bacterium]